jgi:type I restriction enzyme S subunit
VIDGLKPYPAYKDSGVLWLRQLPFDWEMRRNGRLFAKRRETGFPDLPILEVSLKTGVRVRNFDGSQRKQVMSDRSKYQRACKGDIAYNMMRMWQGAVGVAPVDGLISPAYVVAQPYPETDAVYFSHVFRTAEYMREVDDYSRGIVKDRNRLYWDGFKQILSPFPPPREQRAIVRFLAHVDRLIRRYIRAKKKLIAVLNEQNHAIIHHAVTRGLDPNGKFKPSGVGWLGEVPERWAVASLRFRYDQCLGKMVDAKKATGKHLIPYLRNLDVRWDTINTHDLPMIDIAPHERDRFWDGQLEVCGFQKALHRLRPLNSSNDDPKYLYYCLYSAHLKDAFDASSTDNSIPHLTGEMLRAHKFPFPPKEEQTAIAEYLDESTRTIDKAVATAQEAIALVREFQTRLVAEVVAGKLDVREAAARLPDEAVEPEATDDDENLDEFDEDIDSEELEAAIAEAEV